MPHDISGCTIFWVAKMSILLIEVFSSQNILVLQDTEGSQTHYQEEATGHAGSPEQYGGQGRLGDRC